MLFELKSRGASAVDVNWNTAGALTPGTNPFRIIITGVDESKTGSVSCTINNVQYSAVLSIIGKLV